MNMSGEDEIREKLEGTEMSELEKKEVNVEEIMEEIRSNIRNRNKTGREDNIADLGEARELVAKEIIEKKYCNDLPEFSETPDVLPVEKEDIEALQKAVQETMQIGVILPEFPIEGSKVKRIFKKIFQKMMRCVVVPLTGRITETNRMTAQCLKQSVQLIEQQQKQIENLAAQVEKLQKQIHEERKE